MSAGDPLSQPTHRAFLIASGGLLAFGLFLESAIAGLHGVGILQLHEHTLVPVTMHMVAIGSMLLSLWPAFLVSWFALRRSRLAWQLVVVSAACIAVGMDQTMVAALFAFLFSLGWLAWRRFVATRRAAGSDRSAKLD